MHCFPEGPSLIFSVLQWNTSRMRIYLSLLAGEWGLSESKTSLMLILSPGIKDRAAKGAQLKLNEGATCNARAFSTPAVALQSNTRCQCT